MLDFYLGAAALFYPVAVWGIRKSWREIIGRVDIDGAVWSVLVAIPMALLWPAFLLASLLTDKKAAP